MQVLPLVCVRSKKHCHLELSSLTIVGHCASWSQFRDLPCESSDQGRMVRRMTGSAFDTWMADESSPSEFGTTPNLKNMRARGTPTKKR